MHLRKISHQWENAIRRQYGQNKGVGTGKAPGTDEERGWGQRIFKNWEILKQKNLLENSCENLGKITQIFKKKKNIF